MTAQGTSENGVQLYSGKGASTGLPTASADGVVTVIYHQVERYSRNEWSNIDLYTLGKPRRRWTPHSRH
jgi:hypothetical protein